MSIYHTSGQSRPYCKSTLVDVLHGTNTYTSGQVGHVVYNKWTGKLVACYGSMLKKKYFYIRRLDVQLGSSPVSSLRVVSDGVVSLQSDPVRQRSVLLTGLSQLLLGLETLVSLDVSIRTFRGYWGDGVRARQGATEEQGEP